jgi:exodeoxyribonuclease V alpha subunit
MASDLLWSPLGAGVTAMGAGDAGFPEDVVRAASEVDLGPEAVLLAREIVRLAPGLSLASERALLLLILAALASGAEGSTRLPLGEDGPLARLLADLGGTDADRSAVDQLVVRARVVASGRPAEGAEGLAGVVGGPGAYRPLIVDGDHLYLQRMHDLEAAVTRQLVARLEGGADAPYAEAALESALADVVARPVVAGGTAAVLSKNQLDAVRAALRGSLSVVSGRPGSGKTSIVATVLRVLVRLGVAPASIALAAPTGKAADRMRGSITGQLAAIAEPTEADLALLRDCPPAATLHRALGYAPSLDRFRHHQDNPLSERVVIVDESSMVDLVLMDRLLRAVAPGARLVLLGDADQLPSVEAGAVFRDLCRAERLAKAGQVVVLTESFRAEASEAGRRILDTADRINRQDADALEDVVHRRASVSELAYAGVEHLAPGSPDQRDAFLSAWYARIGQGLAGLETGPDAIFEEGAGGFDEETTRALGALHREIERHRILCITRIPSAGTGAMAINAWCHARHLAEARRRGDVDGSPHVLPGEPVLVTRNDYGRNLYNGDSGMVLSVRPEGETEAEPMAVFPRADGFAAFPLEALRGRLELAWATTVHKSQGSEYENVALILPAADVRLLTKEVLYTAVTRARRSVVIVGSADRLSGGTRRAMARYSGVADGLA